MLVDPRGAEVIALTTDGEYQRVVSNRTLRADLLATGIKRPFQSNQFGVAVDGRHPAILETEMVPTCLRHVVELIEPGIE